MRSSGFRGRHWERLVTVDDDDYDDEDGDDDDKIRSSHSYHESK